ncbi:MAG: PAS domain S-box protein [Polyangiaceae bacterium]|nr:PAS domain S-box protein [Polyangiaceae bacterium]
MSDSRDWLGSRDTTAAGGQAVFPPNAGARSGCPVHAAGRFDRIARYEQPADSSLLAQPIPAQRIEGTEPAPAFFEPASETWDDAVRWVLSHKQSCRLDFEHPTGVWLDALLIPEVDAQGNVRSVTVSTHDITERRRAERKLRRLNAVLDTIRAVHRVMVKEKQRRPLIEGICEALIRQGGLQGAWLVLVGGPTDTLESAHEGIAEETFGAWLAQFQRGQLPRCVQQARTQAASVFTVNTADMCRDCPLAGTSGHSVALTAALRHEGRLFGYLGTSLPAQYIDDSDDHTLLGTIVDDIGFSLYALEAVDALREQKELMARILSAASVGLAQAVDRKIVWANEAMERLFRLRPDEYQGQDTRMLYCSQQEYERVGRIVYEQIAAHQCAQLDAEFVRSNGERFSGHVRMNFLDPADRSKGILTSILDITDRKRAEEALRASEEKYRAYVENAPEGIFVIDEAGRYRDVNQAACRLTGYSRDELLGMSIWDVVPADRPRVGPTFFEELKAAGTGQRDIVILHKTGARVPVALQATVVSGGHYLGLCSDLTERRRAAEERARLEEQLRQSQKLEAIGRLAGGVAHDFNNLLTGINGYAEMILESLAPDDPLRSDVREIYDAGRRAAALTDQLLAFSRKQVASPKVVEVNPVIEQSQRMLRRLIGEDIELAFSPGAELGPVLIDPVQLDQVLVNLAVNARDAINARDAMVGGGRLVISTANVALDHERIVMDGDAIDAHGRYVEVAVADNGCGMDQQTVDRIFEPFFSSRKSGRGTGLGLATVYGIVRQNRGFIRVESVPGEGTTFRVYFPRAAGQVSDPLPTPAVASLPCQGTILVVEDDPMVRRLAVRVLREQDHRVLEAENGREALRACEAYAGDIDLVVTDVVMPEMNGRQLFEALRARRPAIQVLYMSGHAEHIIAHQGVLDSGEAFLQKPFSAEELSRKVGQALAH